MNTHSESYVIEHATLRARLLAATAGFSSDEVDDARQELLLDYLRRSPKFDSRRGDWGGFVRGVMRNQATVLITRRCRRIRREMLAGDLFDADCDLPSEFLEDTPRDDAAGLDLALDVQRVLKQLPDPHQRLAYLLSQLPITEVCLTIGKSRSRVYQMIWQIRLAFIKAGLGPRPGGRG